MGGISALLIRYSPHASRETGPAAGRPSDRSPALRDAFLPHPPTLVREPSTTVSPSRSAAEVREWPNRTPLTTHEAVEPARCTAKVMSGRLDPRPTRTRLSSREAERRRRRPPASAPRPRSIPLFDDALRDGHDERLGSCERGAAAGEGRERRGGAADECAAARRERVGRIVRRRGAPGAREAARTSSSTYPMDLERRQPPAASESLLPRARIMLMAPKLRRSGAGAAAAGTM